MFNVIAQAKQNAQILQSSIPAYDLAAERAMIAAQEKAFEAELAYIRETVGFIDNVMLDLNVQETEAGWLDGFWIDLYKLSPRGMTPVYLIFVNQIRFDNITEAVQYMAKGLR